MTSSVAIDVAIGMSFVFFAFSLLCTGVTEWIARVTNMRSTFLLSGLRSLFDQGNPNLPGIPSWLISLVFRQSKAQVVAAPAVDGKATSSEPLLTQLLDHPLIKNLGPTGTTGQPGSTPSYISGDTIAKALVDVLVPSDEGKTTTLDDVTTAINRTNMLADYPKAKDALNAIASSAEGDITKFRTGVEKWYDAQMDRVAGWYKANAKRIALGIGLIIAVALNVNAIKIGETLYRVPGTPSSPGG